MDTSTISSLTLKTSQALEQITEESAIYLVGFLLMMGIWMIRSLLPMIIPDWLFYIPSALFAVGFAKYIYGLISSAIGGVFSKAILSLLFVGISTLSLSFTRQAVNSEMQVPADGFPITVSFLTALMMPSDTRYILIWCGQHEF